MVAQVNEETYEAREGDIDITGLERWEVLQALHAATNAIGMGRLHDRGPLSEADCRAVVEKQDSFDYVAGRPLKVRFRGNWLTGARLYDRDAPRSAADVIAGLRARKESAE